MHKWVFSSFSKRDGRRRVLSSRRGLGSVWGCADVGVLRYWSSSRMSTELTDWLIISIGILIPVTKSSMLFVCSCECERNQTVAKRRSCGSEVKLSCSHVTWQVIHQPLERQNVTMASTFALSEVRFLSIPIFPPMQSTSKWRLAASHLKMASAVPHLPQHSDGTRLQTPTAPQSSYRPVPSTHKLRPPHSHTLFPQLSPSPLGTTGREAAASPLALAVACPLPACHPAVILLAATQRFTACLNDIH